LACRNTPSSSLSLPSRMCWCVLASWRHSSMLAARRRWAMAEIIGMERRPASQPAHWNWRLWLRWVAANAAGEAVGLGLAGALGAGLVLWIEARMGASATLA